MSDLDQTPPKTNRFHWSRVVLAVSLALNLAVVGLVAGAALRHEKRDGPDDDHARTMQSRDFGFGPYIGAFEGDVRRDLGRAFSQKAGGRVEARARVQAQFDAVMAALRSEPFDAAMFESLIVGQQSDLAARQEIGARLLAQKVAQMTPDERSAYASRLDDMIKRGPRDDKGHDDKDGFKK